MNLDTLVLVLLLGTAIPVNGYPVFYVFRPWRTTPTGRALMVKALGNLVLIDMAIAANLFGPDYPGRPVIRVIGFGLFFAGIWYLFWTLMTSEGAEDFPPRVWLRAMRRARNRSS